MNAMGIGFRDRPVNSLYYIDLREQQDDNRVLRNPHKGWYWHYIDQGVYNGNYRVNHDPDDMLLDFPGLHHLYLRVDWADLEPEEGRFDWSLMDEIFDKWGKHGYRFVFRVCTFCARRDRGPRATPAWVFDAGARYTEANGDREPDYGDPVFLEKTGNFMAAFGKRYNGHPLVEAVDIGTFGTWGEGHTAHGTDNVWPLEVMKAHIDMHAVNFPDTWLFLNDDHINHRGIRGDEENMALMEYARGLGIGLRDDSVSVSSYTKRFGFSSLRTPQLFDYFKDNAPIDLELEHYHMIKPDVLKDGLPFLESMMRTGCTYAGFHGYPRPWLDAHRYLTEYAANRLGYWYFIEGATMADMLSGCGCLLTLHVSNRGFARAYRRFDAKMRLKKAETGAEIIIPVDVDNRVWKPGETVRQPLRLSLKGVEPGRYEMAFGLFEAGQSIKLGMSERIEDNGFYTLANEWVVR